MRRDPNRIHTNEEYEQVLRDEVRQIELDTRRAAIYALDEDAVDDFTSSIDAATFMESMLGAARADYPESAFMFALDRHLDGYLSDYSEREETEIRITARTAEVLRQLDEQA